MINIKEEKYYFYNDLEEYKGSIEGENVKKAFASGDELEIMHTLNKYYYHRNVTNDLHYKNDENKKELIETDKQIGIMLHDID